MYIVSRSLGCGHVKLLVETYFIIRILLPDPCVIKISQLHMLFILLDTDRVSTSYLEMSLIPLEVRGVGQIM